MFSLRSTRLSFLVLLFKISLEVQASAIRQEKEIKDYIVLKKLNKAIFVNRYLVVYEENANKSTKKIFLELLRICKVVGYKDNIQVNCVFVYQQKNNMNHQIK